MTRPTHLDESGRLRMVDVSGKAETERTARAEGFLHVSPDALRRALGGESPKGDFVPAVQIAGIAAAKQTGLLIPLCHPLPVHHVAVEVEPDVKAGRLRVEATVTVTARTGVEMEALTAVSVALLAAWDMLKAMDRDLAIDGVRLLEKKGGRSGHWKASGS